MASSLNGGTDLKLNEHAISAGPLLKAIAQAQDPTNAALAQATGRDAKNMARDLARLVDAGWICKGKRPALTDEGRAVLAALQRAEDPEAAQEIPLHLIDEKPGFNPRQAVDAEADAELTASIGDKGVLQAIRIRPSSEPGRFWVTMGHRRRRCALAAGLFTIPAVIRDEDDEAALDAAMIENLQRADMTYLDEARAFQKMIERAQAADPALTLKAAKEAIAARLRKTVRHVELRLNLIELPPIMQAQMQAGKLGPAEARKFLQSRPKPLDLSDEHWLLALEILDAQCRQPVADYWLTACECAADAAQDPRLVEIFNAGNGMVRGPDEVRADGLRTGRFALRIEQWAEPHFDRRFECADLGEPTRERLIGELRKALGVKPAKGARYVTPYLNGPFEVAPEILAEIEAEKQAKADAAAQAEQRRADQDAEAAAKREAAERRLAAAQDLVALLGASPPDPLDRQFAAILGEGGKPLPWCVTPDAGILAANGEAILQGWDRAPPADVLARVTLIALAVNCAAGLPTPQGPGEPAAAEEAAEDEPDSQPFEDPPAGEDDDAGEDAHDEAAADAEDPELPGFLRRLAGCSDRPEARPL